VVKKIGKYLLFGVLFLWTAVAFGQDGTLTARSSRTTVGLNEQFRITFSTTERGGEIQPPAFENFLIVGGPFSSQQTQIINGSVNFQRELTYQLMPKEQGTFNIPPATQKSKNGTLKSNTLEIVVKAGAVREDPMAERAKDAFNVEILTSKKSVYVGEPLVLLLRAYWSKPLRNLNIVQTPNFEGVLQNQLDVQQRERREVIDGKNVTVLDFDKKLLTPTQPGTLGGQELKMSAQLQVRTGRADFWGMPEVTFIPQVATAKIPAVTIKPLPSPSPAGFSGAVGELKLERSLSRTEVSGNESITLKIRISGTGNFNTISVPELIAPQGFDVYDPKFNEKIDYTTSGVRGYKELEYLLVPQFKGNFILPEMRWNFFNTKTEKYEEIVLAEESLVVLSGAEAPASASPTDGMTLQKREVKDIDSDIRYLQSVEDSGTNGGLLWKLIGILGITTLLLWGLQGIKMGGKAPSLQATMAKEKKQVLFAFEKRDADRFGLMLNTLENRLIARGMTKEGLQKSALIEAFGQDQGAQLHRLMELCQMAQYAHGAIGDDAQVLNEFKAIWEWI